MSCWCFFFSLQGVMMFTLLLDTCNLWLSLLLSENIKITRCLAGVWLCEHSGEPVMSIEIYLFISVLLPPKSSKKKPTANDCRLACCWWRLLLHECSLVVSNHSSKNCSHYRIFYYIFRINTDVMKTKAVSRLKYLIGINCIMVHS